MVRQAKTGTRKPKEVPKPSPVSNIGQIASLKRYSDKDYANSILHDVVKAVAKIIHEYDFKVGTLCEMFPKDPRLLGLNVNRGQKILIRLRYHHNDKLFIPFTEIVGTFLHELTHNIHGPHDEKFYEFLNKLKSRFEDMQYNNIAGNDGYRCEEQKLGGNSLNMGYTSIRDKRLKALTPIFKAESRKLGGLSVIGLDAKAVRDLRLQAIERRIKDSKWCQENVSDDVVPQDSELDVIELDDENKENENKQNENNRNKRNITKINDDQEKPKRRRLDKPVDPELKEIIDLTNEEYGDPVEDIIVIDACKSSFKKKRSPGDVKHQRKVQFELLPSFDEEVKSNVKDEDGPDEAIYYSVSTSPSHFIVEEGTRHKYVAELNFQQILAKGNTVNQLKPTKKPKKSTKAKKEPKEKVKRKPRIPRKKVGKSKSETTIVKKTVKTVKTILFKELL